MSLYSKQKSFQRIKWDTKTDKQKEKYIDKYLNELGVEKSKSLQGKLTKSKETKLINRINNEFNRQIKQEKKIAGEYMDIKRQYNKLVSNLNEKALKGRTSLEKQYLKGNMLHVPTIQSQSFQADKLTFRQIGKEEFSDLKAKQERINQLKRDMKTLKKQNISDDNFYNIKHNKESFENMMSGCKLDENSKNLLINMYNAMTPFEQELFAKNGLQKIRDKYLKEGQTEIDDKDIGKSFNAMYGIMRGIVIDNRNKSMYVSSSGKIYYEDK